MSDLPQHQPQKKKYPERIGDTEYLLEEERLDIFDEIELWHDNPRVTPMAAEKRPDTPAELESYLQRTPGYEGLKASIRDIGQLEPVYAWRQDSKSKYLVLEGSTRLAILRELYRRHEGTPDADRFRYIRAKILPPEFSEQQRAILLARIHVRGSGVRSWGRYIEAKFIYEHVVGVNGQKPIMNVTDMANYMGKSASWVSRLKSAYEFAEQYVDFLDNDKAQQHAVKQFSTLEEISKSTGFGKLVKDDEDLRDEVFEMVRNEVFKEYRDARFMKQYYDDPEKWAELKTYKQHVAHDLANQIKAGGTSVSGKIASLVGQMERAISADPDSLGNEDLEELNRAVLVLSSHVGEVTQFRYLLARFTKALHNASLNDVKAVTPEEIKLLNEGLADFRARWDNHHGEEEAVA